MNRLSMVVYVTLDLLCRFTRHWNGCRILNNRGPIGRLWVWAAFYGEKE